MDSVLTLIEREAFLKAYEDDNDIEVGLRKGVADVVKGVNIEERTVNTLISTDAIDRDRDTINQKKWDLKAYRKNPVVQFAHDHHIPVIAQSIKVGVVNGKLATTDKFTPEGEHPFADMIFNLVKGKFIRAKSVGFKPERGKFEFDGERGGFDFNGQELLEHSYVNVPSNPEALVGAKAAGIDLAPLIKWAEAVLDDDGRLWLPRETVERALKIAENERTVITVNGWKLLPAHDETPAVIIAEIEVPDSKIDMDEVEASLDTTTLEAVQELVLERLGQKEPDDDEITTAFLCPLCEDADKAFMFTDGQTDEYKKHLQEVHKFTIEEADDPAPDKGDALTSLLDSLPAPEQKTEVSDEEVEFLGQALGEAIAGTVRETVRERLTAMTGKLD